MSDQPKISNSFLTFMKEAPQHSKAWMDVVKGLDSASALDSKTEELAYIAVLAATRLESGLSFHVKHAKKLGATREEIISSVLIGLPAVGNIVIQALPIALDAFDD
ncbi:carboxymuconolactone decarboxylase family protein [Tepidibacter hydrothermalis]|uniref:Carboxymuconolactone decarboxylase family protein n=1 Tax=Tepidibacter hydrothermalis TaxID=3036126 RepID=A0ABY8E7T0_9FIRM|nr:carboxymuconolactone decarboxylase family protein [Tepidibacter hydrothermalis]WFD08942.1 carboxymuconolactone decarboxylase family protein [Tepidibacter hydrothermalis]